MGRTMGLDVGDKTVGVAVSDELGFSAQGITTVRRAGWQQDLGELKRLAEKYEVDRVVVGLPLNMDGSEGPRAALSRTFSNRLSEALGLPSELWDERLSTVAAERVLLEANVSRRRRKEVIDQVAATVILQGFLDAQRPAPEHEEDE